MRIRARPRVRARGAAASDVRAALDAFRRIVQALRAGSAAGEPGASISSAQLFALRQIAEHPGASINDVAARTFTHQSSVSVVVRRLVQRRLVARTAAGDDRRRQCLSVTGRGLRMLKRAPGAVQERLIAAIFSLPAAERQALARLLGEVARAVALPGTGALAPMFFEEGDGFVAQRARRVASRARASRRRPGRRSA